MFEVKISIFYSANFNLTYKSNVGARGIRKLVFKFEPDSSKNKFSRAVLVKKDCAPAAFGGWRAILKSLFVIHFHATVGCFNVILFVFVLFLRFFGPVWSHTFAMQNNFKDETGFMLHLNVRVHVTV